LAPRHGLIAGQISDANHTTLRTLLAHCQDRGKRIDVMQLPAKIADLAGRVSVQHNNFNATHRKSFGRSSGWHVQLGGRFPWLISTDMEDAPPLGRSICRCLSLAAAPVDEAACNTERRSIDHQNLQ
jgi:hypothetical protein